MIEDRLVNRGDVVPVFDAPDHGAVDPGALRELRLREALRFAQTVDGICHLFCTKFFHVFPLNLLKTAFA